MKRLAVLLKPLRAARVRLAAGPAQTYPNRTVSVVVPFPAGGSVDVVARLLVQKLNEIARQPLHRGESRRRSRRTVGANASRRRRPTATR